MGYPNKVMSVTHAIESMHVSDREPGSKPFLNYLVVTRLFTTLHFLHKSFDTDTD